MLAAVTAAAEMLEADEIIDILFDEDELEDLLSDEMDDGLRKALRKAARRSEGRSWK